MAYSDAQKEATARYNKKAYDFISVVVPKGKRKRIADYAASQGKSMNRFINDAIDAGQRIISVGTTSTRTLESAAVETPEGFRIQAGHNSTGIFIYPGYEFKIVKALITNFHLPKSTLLMLMSALYVREHILEAYEEAVREKYRFFSYGDAMLIE